MKFIAFMTVGKNRTSFIYNKKRNVKEQNINNTIKLFTTKIVDVKIDDFILHH